MVATGLRAGTGSGVQAGSSTSQTRVASVARRNCFPAWHTVQTVGPAPNPLLEATFCDGPIDSDPPMSHGCGSCDCGWQVPYYAESVG
jgi:hypothetical protein